MRDRGAPGTGIPALPIGSLDGTEQAVALAPAALPDHADGAAANAVPAPGRIVIPAGLRLRAGQDCRVLEQPVYLAGPSRYALDYLCQDRLLRIALDD